MEYNTKTVKPQDIITSLERSFSVIRCFDREAQELTPADVAKRTGLSRAVCRRILLTLEKLGYTSSDGKRFRLTPMILDLSHGYLAKVRVAELIEPILIDAMADTQDTCAFMIRDAKEMMCIARSNAATFGSVMLEIGVRRPLHQSSSGRVILASFSEDELAFYLSGTVLKNLTARTIVSKSEFLKEISKVREQGFAITIGEQALGVYSMTVPVNSSADRVIGGVTAIGNAARVSTDEQRQSICSGLRQAAERISAILPMDYDFSADRSGIIK